jgi:4'-phosphopantetheinyl transferase
MVELDNVWKLPPSELTLPHDEIHIWRASLDQLHSFLEQLGQTLSADERTRAERFHFARDRQRFIISRGLLRNILGRYMGIKPELLQFRSGPYGKLALAETRPFIEANPALTAEWGNNPLQFNVSHSETLALYAFTRGREIGIDVEYVRPVAEAEQIAERYFSAPESNILRNLPPDTQDEQFLIYWTRKEAYLKACGEGLTGLETMRSQLYNSSVPTGWFIQQLRPAPGYVAALAIQKQTDKTPIRLVYWQWVPMAER